MLSAHGVQVLQLSFVKVTHSLSVLSLPASAPGWESLLSMICPQHDSLDSMVANYIVTHRMHPHTPLIWYNWQGLGYCYIIHLLSCCRVLTITFQSGEPPPSALRYALPCPALNRTVHSAAATATSCCHVCWKMRPVKCWLWSSFSDCCWCQRIQPYVSGAHKTDAGAAACLTHITAGSSFCSQPDRLHQLYKRCFYLFIFLKGGKKVFSLWNDPKMLWFWDKQLCQRVSIKNLYATARLWSSRRERERFHLQRADANNQQTRELWMYLSYFTSLIATGTAHQILLISVYL